MGYKGNDLDHKKERWTNVFRIALGQSKMVVRPIAGILHVVVYVGFKCWRVPEVHLVILLSSL